jgi:ribosomal protein L40E
VPLKANDPRAATCKRCGHRGLRRRAGRRRQHGEMFEYPVGAGSVPVCGKCFAELTARLAPWPSAQVQDLAQRPTSLG